MANKKTLFLLCSTLCAGLVAAFLALALVSGPAVSREMTASAAEATPAAACRTATWPYIPAECLTRVVDGRADPAAPIGAFTYARPVGAR
ncbi:MAG: hypothetical protein ACTHJ3_14600 [Pararhizobium sp.]